MTLRVSVGGGLTASPVLRNASDEFAAHAENISEDQDRIEEQRDIAEAARDFEEANEDAAAARSQSGLGGTSMHQNDNSRAQRARERSERASRRASRAAARAARRNERQNNRGQRRQQEINRKRDAKASDANNLLANLNAIKVQEAREEWNKAIKAEREKQAAAAIREKREENERNRTAAERAFAQKTEFNMKVFSNIPAEENIATKQYADARSAERDAVIREAIVNATIPASPPIFRPPLITRNRHEFRNLENSTRLRGRIEIDPEADLNLLMRDASLSPRRPEIIAKIPLFQLLTNYEGVSELNDLRKYERNLQLEELDALWENIKKADIAGIVAQSSRNSADALEKNIKNLEFFSTLNDTLTQSVDLLDIRKNSRQLTTEAKNYSRELLIAREEDYTNYPDSIESFLSEKCLFSSLSPNYFSNTKLLHTIFREFSNAIRYYFPGLLTSQDSRRDDRYSFKYPAVRQKKQGDNSPEASISSWGTRNFVIARTATGTFSGRNSVTETYYNVIPGIKDFRTDDDKIKVLATLLHNELVVSSGIARLYNTRLGNKYSVTSVDPVERIMGGYFKNSGNVLNGAGSPMSFCDMLVLNEFAQNAQILPFEQGAVKDLNSKIYVPGSSYFIESPIKTGDLTTPLSSFNTTLTEVNSDAQDMLKKLLCFDEDCKFTPDNIVIRCLRSMRDIVAILAINSETNKVPIDVSFPASLLTLMGSKDFIRQQSIFSSPYRQEPIDTLFALCAQIRRDFDIQESNQAFTPLKSYSKSVNPDIHPFENDEMIDDLGFFDNLTRSTLNLAFKTNIAWSEATNLSGLLDPARSLENPDVVALQLIDTSKTNALSSITSVLRSIQQDVYEVSLKNESGVSYLDGDKLTRFNRWDDNTMFACVFEITRLLFENLLDIGANVIDKINVSWDSLRILRLRDFLDILLNAYDADQPLDSVFDANGDADSIFGVNQSTTFRAGGFSAGQIVELLKSLIDQRKFLKLNLGYLSAVTKNVNSSNSIVTTFFESNASTNNENARMYSDLLASLGGRLAIETLSPEQNNIKQNYLLSAQPIEKPSLLQKCSFNTSIEDQVQEFFIKEMFNTANDGIAICFGLPSGLIRSERHPVKVESSNSENEDEAYPDASAKKKNIKATFNKVSELYPNIVFSPVDIEYDSELFILPESLNFRSDYLTGEMIKDMSSLVEGTLYTRIANGRVVSSKTGQELIAEGYSELILRNHIVDRVYKHFVRDVLGITLDEHAWFMDGNFNSLMIDNLTYMSLEKLVSNENISSLTNLSLNKLRLLFEDVKVPGLEGMKKICSSSKLSLLLNDDVNYNDINTLIKMLSSSAFNANVGAQRLLSPRHFDRVFVALFSNDRGSNFFLNNFNISEVNALPGDIDNLKKVFSNFELSGYMCSVELK